MQQSTPLERVLRRDRAVVIGSLVGIVVLAWVYIFLGAGIGMTAFQMTAISSKSGAIAPMQPVSWTPGYAVLMVFMWWIMMMAMMLPSAAPMILLFAAVNRKQRARDGTYVATGVFAAGYIAVWGGFSIAAAGAQWMLERVALLSPAMTTSSVVLGGVLLIGGGLYQLTPLKFACLRHCRSPIQFLAAHYRPGPRGALRMGVEHGAFCLGCCWVLMALLFYGGVMNLYWIAGLAVYVLLEKTIPAGHRMGSLAGIGLVVWGGVVIAAAL